MWANSVIFWVVRLLSIPVAIVGLITTFLGGILLGIPVLGLVVALLLNVVWLPFFGILLGTGWVWRQAPRWLHPVIALVGIPVAVIGNTFLALSPAGGGSEDLLAKWTKQTLCQSWPYAWADDSGLFAVDVMQQDSGETYFRSVMLLADLKTRQQAAVSAD